MEEGEEEVVSVLSRKELRKQKLMEYLAGKGKLKPPNPKQCDSPHRTYVTTVVPRRNFTSSLQVVQGKENAAPPDRVTHGGGKCPNLAYQSTKHGTARKTLGDSNKGTVKANILTGWQNAGCPSAAGGPAQPIFNLNPALTRRPAGLSAVCNPTAAGHLKKQPNPVMPSSGRSHSNASRMAVNKPNGRFASSSKATGSRPPAAPAASVRMSLGPMVKTKTGLIPAVTQPRNVQSQRLKHAAAPDPITSATATAAKKTQSRSLPPASVTRKSAMTQKKPLPATSLNNHESARAAVKVPNASKSNTKPSLSRNPQGSSKIPSASGPKSTAAPQRPQGRAAGPPADRFPKQRSGGAGQPRTAAPRPASGPASRCGPRAASAEAEAAGKRGRSLANAPPPHTGMKRTSAPGTSHTVPRPGRTIGRTGQRADAEAPKAPAKAAPHTEGKKVTAAQEERMRKLQEWREAKGISYKRPAMPVKPQVRSTVAVPQPFWGAMNEEDEAQSLIGAVDRSLADCIKLLAEGCPAGQVREVLSRLPAVSRKFAKYWICQARLLEQEGHLEVLPMFEEAVAVVLEPVDELRAVVFEILKRKDEIQVSSENLEEERRERTPESIGNNQMMTPKPVRALICGETGDSSVVKYKITATPGGPSRQQATPARVNGQEVRFFTPVRRSVRIERSSLRYPASLQDHDLCVTSYGDLIHEEAGESGDERGPAASGAPMYVYRQNDALQDKVFVQLVYDDAV